MSTKFRNSHWLKTNGFAPQIYLFKNIESGQVVYSQTPHITQYQIKQQFFRPNWENRLPSKRRDLWRPMAVLQFTTYETAIRAYHALVELRYMRQVSKKKEAESLRKRNEYGHIWYSGQFRPTWAQEAASDVSLVIDEFKLKDTKIFWESLWRKGDDKHWNQDLVRHLAFDSIIGPREGFVVLDEIRKAGLEDFSKYQNELANVPQTPITSAKSEIAKQ